MLLTVSLCADIPFGMICHQPSLANFRVQSRYQLCHAPKSVRSTGILVQRSECVSECARVYVSEHERGGAHVCVQAFLDKHSPSE